MRRVLALFGSCLAIFVLTVSLGGVMAAARGADESPGHLGGEPATHAWVQESSASPASLRTISSTQVYTQFLPAVFTPGPPIPPPLPAPLAYSSTTLIDFATARTELQQQGLELAPNKIGFHTGLAANDAGLLDWMAALDAAGVPFFLKSVDNAEPLLAAQQMMQQSGVPHTLVYRRAGHPWDVPNYSLPPQQAAEQHWAMHTAAWPPELDPSLVWFETVNELDKNRAEWLGQFSLATAQLALADGYRWAAFGWSSGEPEPSHWQQPAVRQFLRLAADHPERLAVALHEYSYDGYIANQYPYLVGRFQSLFHVCDLYQIPRPTVLITEWGWEYNRVPEPSVAMEQIRWASWLYAAYPQVKGAAIWYLGGGFGGIADGTQRLIAPVRDFTLSHYYGYTPGMGGIDASLFTP